MKRDSLLVRVIINAIAFLVVSWLYSGIQVNDFKAALITALILGLINAFLRPVLIVLTLPINFLTFGLFTFVINGLLLLLVSNLYSGLYVGGFLAAVFAALLLSIVNAILSSLLVKND